MTPITMWIAARLTEPSTWAGIALLADGIGNAVTTKDWSSVIKVIGGALAAVIAEKNTVKT